MQRVKAHELRQKDEKSLVEELTKNRVSDFSSLSNVGLNACRKSWLSSELARSPLLPRLSSPA